MKTLRIATFLTLSFVTVTVFAALPPNYLSINHWKRCVSTYHHQGADFVCLPDHKPLNCPNDSWMQLIHHTNLIACPPVDRSKNKNVGSSNTQRPN